LIVSLGEIPDGTYCATSGILLERASLVRSLKDNAAFSLTARRSNRERRSTLRVLRGAGARIEWYGQHM